MKITGSHIYELRKLIGGALGRRNAHFETTFDGKAESSNVSPRQNRHYACDTNRQLLCYLAKTQLGIQASMSAFFDLQAAKVGRHCGDFIFPERHLISSHISTFLNTLQPMTHV